MGPQGDSAVFARAFVVQFLLAGNWIRKSGRRLDWRYCRHSVSQQLSSHDGWRRHVVRQRVQQYVSNQSNSISQFRFWHCFGRKASFLSALMKARPTCQNVQTASRVKMPEFDATFMTLLGINSTACLGVKFVTK